MMWRVLLCLAAWVSLLNAGPVLVLPFFNLSKSANLDWIGESISENVREALASEGLLVLERDDRLEALRRLSVQPGAMLTHATVIKIGQALDAAQVVYGHYELVGPPADSEGDAGAARGSLRIVARVLDLQHIRQGPEYHETGALEDLAQLESRLGWQTLHLLAPDTAPPQQEFLAARPPVRLDAEEHYVRGLLAASPEQKHRLFTQAARLDQGFSRPCYQLGKFYWDKKEYRVAATWLTRVNRSSSHYLEAQFFLGLSKYYQGDFAGAAACFRTVSEKVPLNEVWNNLGAAQARQGLKEAAENYKKALEGDDGDPDYHFNLGCVLWRAGRFEDAARSFRAALERNPDDAEATTCLGRVLKKDALSRAESTTAARERVKTTYEETAYRQLKAELEKKVK